MVEDESKIRRGQALSGTTPPGAGSAGEGFVTIAKVIKTQGRKGGVAAMLFTGFPERFSARKRLVALNEDEKAQRRQLELEDHWFHKNQVVLKFKGVDSISDAEALVGSEIQVPFEERTSIEADEIYVSDLTGCMVYDAGRKIGRIQDVQFGAVEAPLLAIKGEKEYLVPFATEYIEKIELQRQRIEMKLPQGMLELDAPLSAEEKRQQNQSD